MNPSALIDTLAIWGAESAWTGLLVGLAVWIVLAVGVRQALGSAGGDIAGPLGFGAVALAISAFLPSDASRWVIRAVVSVGALPMLALALALPLTRLVGGRRADPIEPGPVFVAAAGLFVLVQVLPALVDHAVLSSLETPLAPTWHASLAALVLLIGTGAARLQHFPRTAAGPAAEVGLWFLGTLAVGVAASWALGDGAIPPVAQGLGETWLDALIGAISVPWWRPLAVAGGLLVAGLALAHLSRRLGHERSQAAWRGWVGVYGALTLAVAPLLGFGTPVATVAFAVVAVPLVALTLGSLADAGVAKTRRDRHFAKKGTGWILVAAMASFVLTEVGVAVGGANDGSELLHGSALLARVGWPLTFLAACLLVISPSPGAWPGPLKDRKGWALAALVVAAVAAAGVVCHLAAVAWWWPPAALGALAAVLLASEGVKRTRSLAKERRRKQATARPDEAEGYRTLLAKARGAGRYEAQSASSRASAVALLATSHADKIPTKVALELARDQEAQVADAALELLSGRTGEEAAVALRWVLRRRPGSKGARLAAFQLADHGEPAALLTFAEHGTGVEAMDALEHAAQAGLDLTPARTTLERVVASKRVPEQRRALALLARLSRPIAIETARRLAGSGGSSALDFYRTALELEGDASTAARLGELADIAARDGDLADHIAALAIDDRDGALAIGEWVASRASYGRARVAHALAREDATAAVLWGYCRARARAVGSLGVKRVPFPLAAARIAAILPEVLRALGEADEALRKLAIKTLLSASRRPGDEALRGRLEAAQADASGPTKRGLDEVLKRWQSKAIPKGLDERRSKRSWSW